VFLVSTSSGTNSLLGGQLLTFNFALDYSVPWKVSFMGDGIEPS